jgi:prepilin-type N-terminal cleavage/methylation domain-containing protein/prepilin-type processing-associated H-X9-DG protein
MTRRRGFSLIELLVVITIIVVLAGLLIVSIRQVLTAARRVTCASNLRQIGVALLAYSEDNNGFFPSNNSLECASWPYIFGDWGTGVRGVSSNFYAAYLPLGRKLFFCPEGRSWQANTGADTDDGWKYFPNKPPAQWISSINYCYFAGPDENQRNNRGGPKGEMDGTPRSTLIADLMRFGQTDYTLVTTWNHRGGARGSGGSRLDGRCGGNMCYLDGHVGWMSGAAELLRHRQKMKGNDAKSYAAEQANDP